MGTMVPAVYSPEPEPPFTTTLYFVPFPDTESSPLLLSPLPPPPPPLPPPFPPPLLPGLFGLFGSLGLLVLPLPSVYTAKISRSFVTFCHASDDHFKKV